MKLPYSHRLLTSCQLHLLEGAIQSDIIILALPVEITKAYLAELGRVTLKSNVLVTDTGSTKAEIVQFAQQFSF